jgi:type II secretory pathway component GspD/PulD (secretin)
MHSRLLTSAIFFVLLFSSITAFAELSADEKERNDKANYFSVEFDKAPLSEIVMVLAQYSGDSFVISSAEDLKLSWAEKNIYKGDLIAKFKDVLLGAGYFISPSPNYKNLHIIKGNPYAIGGVKESLGFYKVKNLEFDSLKDTSETLFGKALAINKIEWTNVVLFSGNPDTVVQFSELLQKVDTPKDVDIATIHLKNISVKSAIKALSDTKLIKDESYYPDYWGRAIIVKGSNYEQNVARTIIKEIDKPQQGWVDQLEYVHTTETANIVEVLNSACPAIETRKIAADRILLSGTKDEVEKASVLLHKIDGSGMQVKVEAVIAYLTDTEFKELGVKLGYTDARNNAKLNSNLVDSLITQNTGMLLQYFNEFINVTAAAEEGKSHGEILSSPVLTVLNGQTAKISVGQNVPYISKANYNENDGTTTGTSVERKDVGITFTVTDRKSVV